MGNDQYDERAILRHRGAELAAALDNVSDQKAKLRAAVRLAAAVGVSEVEIARLAGISRPTVRDWLGKT